LKGSSSRGVISRKTATKREPDQNMAGRRNGAFGRTSYDGKSAKGLGKRGKS